MSDSILPNTALLHTPIRGLRRHCLIPDTDPSAIGKSGWSTNRYFKQRRVNAVAP